MKIHGTSDSFEIRKISRFLNLLKTWFMSKAVILIFFQEVVGYYKKLFPKKAHEENF